MKRVGMDGQVQDQTAREVGKPSNKRRKSATTEERVDWEALEAEEEDDGGDGEEDEGQERKKRKIKHGLDGKPVKKGKEKEDPLAGLMSDKKKGKKKEKSAQQQEDGAGSRATPLPKAKPTAKEQISDEDEEEAPVAETSAPAAAPASLTTLQNSMSSQLSSAKFRWLNEKLYTIPSGEAVGLMRNEGGRAFDDVSQKAVLLYSKPIR